MIGQEAKDELSNNGACEGNGCDITGCSSTSVEVSVFPPKHSGDRADDLF